MDLQATFQFLIDLKFNNTRAWFNEHKDRYLSAKNDFDQFIEALIPQLKQQDSSIDVSTAKECVFRIYRDARFSKNKEPYKTNFGAFISKGGRKSPYAGYYIHFEPDNSFIGGGIYMPQAPVLKSIRTSIFEDSEAYKKIIHNKQFTQRFPEIYGQALKMAPKGFPKDYEDIDLLKNKHYAVTHAINNDFWFDENTSKNILDTFKTQYKFNQFLNIAVDAVKPSDGEN